MSEAIDELKAFVDEHLPRWLTDWAGRTDSWEAALAWQRTLTTGRWTAPGWPEEHGGRGLGIRDTLAAEDVLANAGAPRLPGMLGVKNVGPTLRAWGDRRQREHLRGILTTDEIWCQGFSEPGAGSDLASLRTRAVRDGEDFVVNGQKTWTSNGLQATHMQLLARTDPDAPKHKGISVLLVDMDSPGIQVRPIRQINGDTGFAEVFFTDVRVPADSLLGPLNEGWRVTMTTLGHERAGVAAFAGRLEQRARDAVSAHGAGGKGRELSSLEWDEMLSRYVESRVVGMLGRDLLDRLDVGETPGAEQSIIKLVWSETSQRLDRTLTDISGADAVLGTDRSMAHVYLTAPATTIAAGTTQIVKNLLAERVLGLPR